MLRFPEEFVWGAATAAYQIEGGVDQGGRGETIWDRFSHTPGRVSGGDTGDVACDHYHRWREDVALMKELGLRAYRFSVAWSRIFPQGRGKVNREGLDFYERLVDGLLDAGIQPAVTLYHWDLPQGLQDRGGWDNRDCADYFTEYAHAVFGALSDRVKFWITHNEPWVAAFVGNEMGRHAPGNTDFALALRVAHVLALSHAKTVRMFRADFPHGGQIGITLNLHPAQPLKEADEEAARRHDGYLNRWFLDPAFLGRYPADMVELYTDRGLAPELGEGDSELLGSASIDFLGVNYYTREIIRRSTREPLEAESEVPAGAAVTEMGWEIYPQGLYELLMRLHVDYDGPDLYITENGAAFRDDVLREGVVQDDDRIDYVRRHLQQAHRAMTDGVRLKGYFVWSLMDNFEWALGYSRRFGIVHVDYKTLERKMKKSATWYQRVIQEGGVEE